MLPLNSLWIIDWAFPEKENQQGGRGHTFLKNPWNFLFLLLKPLEIPDKTKLHPWKFHKIALDPLEIPRPSHQDPWKFHIIFFLVTLLNSFCYFFDTPRNSIPILYPFPHPVWFSSGIAHLTVDDGQLASYLPACKLRRFLRAWFAPAVRWNFGMVANSVYITESLSWFFLLIFDENLTDFIPPKSKSNQAMKFGQ